MKERDDFKEKYEMLRKDKDGGGREALTAVAASPGNSYERKYREIKEEYKIYRKKAKEFFDSQKMDADAAAAPNDQKKEAGAVVSEQDVARLAYLHSLMLNYLSSKEGSEAKVHMERAIGTVLRFTEEERQMIQKKRQEGSAEDVVGGVVADMFGGFEGWFQ
mmetsp:Transcript_40485/g.95098  ORF Transcript_40485/g.95098 Transcript_40485/m.95098 type:complete len:162 (-) Transcript_40485:197-682(-)